jgi:hypothetical protein
MEYEVALNLRPLKFHPFILLVFTLSFGCGTEKKFRRVEVVWNDNRAVALLVPRKYFLGTADDSLVHVLKVQLAQPETRPILGECVKEKNAVLFRPLVPLTRGLTYEVRIRDVVVERVKIAPAATLDIPRVLAIYPSQDTLPANLLKLYLTFSQPMQEGRSASFIGLKEGNRVVDAAFLELKPELWNKDGTMLSVWLDPGRIKRDLKPNLLIGAPLAGGKKYTL